MRITYKILLRKSARGRQVVKSRHGWEGNIKTGIQKVGIDGRVVLKRVFKK
jgi:hypothetical protein